MTLNQEKISFLQRKLLKWGKDNYRDYYWRTSTNPFHILIAEMMLHRTKSDQVAIVYADFIREYNTPKKLSMATYTEIYDRLKPLGLFWRIKNFIECAKMICEKYDSMVPNKKEELLMLPGVGDYIAGAVMCIAFGIKTPLLDSNIIRILGRVYGYPITENSRRNQKYLITIDNLLPDDKCKEFLFALIDFGHFICISKNPKCEECLINTICTYKLNNK